MEPKVEKSEKEKNVRSGLGGAVGSGWGEDSQPQASLSEARPSTSSGSKSSSKSCSAFTGHKSTAAPAGPSATSWSLTRNSSSPRFCQINRIGPRPGPPDPGLEEAGSSSPSPDVVRNFLSSIHLGQYTSILLDNGYENCADLLRLTREDLQSFGVKPGHALRLLDKLPDLQTRLEPTASLPITSNMSAHNLTGANDSAAQTACPGTRRVKTKKKKCDCCGAKSGNATKKCKGCSKPFPKKRKSPSAAPRAAKRAKPSPETQAERHPMTQEEESGSAELEEKEEQVREIVQSLAQEVVTRRLPDLIEAISALVSDCALELVHMQEDAGLVIDDDEADEPFTRVEDTSGLNPQQQASIEATPAQIASSLQLCRESVPIGRGCSSALCVQCGSLLFSRLRLTQLGHVWKGSSAKLWRKVPTDTKILPIAVTLAGEGETKALVRGPVQTIQALQGELTIRELFCACAAACPRREALGWEVVQDMVATGEIGLVEQKVFIGSATINHIVLELCSPTAGKERQ